MKSPGHSDHCRCHGCRGQHEEGRTPLVTLCDVSLRRGERLILDRINFTIDRGDFIAITGPNGGGKTSLLRLILGLLKPSSGTITFEENNSNPKATPSIGYLPQKNAIDSHFPITVEEVVSSGLLAQKYLSAAEKKERVNEILKLIEMDYYAHQAIGRLSGGQLQRTLFGRAIIRRPEILILDEPLSYLDRHFEQRLYDIIADMASSTTILLVSHQLGIIDRMANRHVVVDRSLTECTAEHHNIILPDCEN